MTVNQRVNGGQWNLLGTFPFNSGGTGYKVELSDNVTTGKVAADAIRYVLDESSTDSFTWMLDVPSAGSYQLYARWVASSANTSAAQYTVTHAGGSSPVTVSQKQNGGQWHLLDTYNFAPDAGHKVTLAAAADGTVIADAVLLVGSGAPPSNLLYVHADHLGTPQKLTDVSQAIVWDGEFEPFGEEIAISGTAELPLRFPGQYADTETGYSYNYFRDYDPMLGRYVQSDLIGLNGGVNTYSYALANPIVLYDSRGLAVPMCCKPIPGTGYWHCYAKRTDPVTGQQSTRGLHQQGGSTGHVRKDFGFDLSRAGEQCGPQDPDPLNLTWLCVTKFADAYPDPSHYDYNGPNSNTFASNCGVACKLLPPPIATPGGLSNSPTPGWGDPVPSSPRRSGSSK